LETVARGEVAAQGIPAVRIAAKRTLHLKYEGTDTTLEIAAGTAAAIVAEFERKYRAQYGFLMPGKPLIVEAIAVEAVGRSIPLTRRYRCSRRGVGHWPRSKRSVSTPPGLFAMPPFTIATTCDRATP
jgi:N-methylhydantoinase A/oxoprolinase/acetone carboxylase beta subunit